MANLCYPQHIHYPFTLLWISFFFVLPLVHASVPSPPDFAHLGHRNKPTLGSLPSTTTDEFKTVPGTFIFELQYPSGDETGKKSSPSPRKGDNTAQKKFRDELSKRNIPHKVRKEFTSSPQIFHGISIQIESHSSNGEGNIDGNALIPVLESLPQVKSVWPNRIYNITTSNHDHKRFKKHHHHHKMVPVDPSARTASSSRLEPRKNSYTLPSPEAFKNDTFSPHVMIGADKLHEQGVLGQGVKVAILDTGVDYSHPALGGCFGKGCKVSFGTDFVGDNFNPNAGVVAQPDNDPMDTCNGHGTHVTGIVAADPNPLGFTGVAPFVELGMYRITGCAGSTDDETMITALITAAEDGAQVISVSLGASSGWIESGPGIAASRVVDQGVIVVFATGNDGQSGLFSSAAPGTAPGVWAIGSVEVAELQVNRRATTDAGKDIHYTSLSPFNVTLPVYTTSPSSNNNSDLCQYWPNSPDLSDFVVLVQISSDQLCSWEIQYSNLGGSDAKYILFSNYEGGSPFYTTSNREGVAMISTNDGEFLRERAAAGKNTTIDFTSTDFTSLNNMPSGGFMDYYSSWGPTIDMFFQPSLVSVGGDILSTWPVNLGAYEIESGTSMATPLAAGAAALWLSIDGQQVTSPKDILARFTSSASVLINNTGSETKAPVVQQGPGLINLTAALSQTVFATPAIISLNDTEYGPPNGEVTITLINTGVEDETYDVSHSPSLTALLYGPGGGPPYSAAGDITLDLPAAVKFSTEFLVVPAGGNSTIIVTFTPPGKNIDQWPVYGGWIEFGNVVRVPYFGAANVMYGTQILTVDDTFPYVSFYDTSPQNGSHTYSFNGTDSPWIVWETRMGSQAITIDLVDPDISFTPTWPDIYDTSIRSAWPETNDSTLYDDVKTVGRCFVQRFGALGELVHPNWLGNVTNSDGVDVQVPNGEYRFLIRALKVTGNRTLERDWESWLSPIVGVKRR